MTYFDTLRKEYQSRGIDADSLHEDPHDQFEAWLEEAIEKSPGSWLEPNAMSLATASASGDVSVRTVLLKQFGTEGFIFFTSLLSEKSRQIQENPNVSLLFHWPYLGRQIRIDGRASVVDDGIADHYFNSRPRGAQLGAHASVQSSVIPSREALQQRVQQLQQQFHDSAVNRPKHWSGFAVKPHLFEFWQGREDRLHDRLRYRRSEDHQSWIIERLAP